MQVLLADTIEGWKAQGLLAPDALPAAGPAVATANATSAPLDWLLTSDSPTVVSAAYQFAAYQLRDSERANVFQLQQYTCACMHIPYFLTVQLTLHWEYVDVLAVLHTFTVSACRFSQLQANRSHCNRVDWHSYACSSRGKCIGIDRGQAAPKCSGSEIARRVRAYCRVRIKKGLSHCYMCHI